MRITLRQLQVFVAITRNGSVSAASQQIGLTQSAASMALSELENNLNTPLFDRIGKRLQISSYGQSQLAIAESILTQAEKFEHGDSNKVTGHLTLGASMTIGSYLIPEIVKTFQQTYPEVSLKLNLRNSADIIKSVINFDADLGLIEGLCLNPQVSSIPWREDKLCIFAANDSPWAKLIEQPEKLLKAPWILREAGSGTRAILEHSLGSEREQLHVHLELASHEAIKQAVLVGLGIGCLSETVVAEEIRDGRLIDLTWSGLNLQRALSLIWLPNRYQSNAAKAFIGQLGMKQELEAHQTIGK